MDLIDRQAAIDALKPCAGVGNRALDKLRALPSVEPEIVRCKDCRHFEADIMANPWGVCCHDGWVDGHSGHEVSESGWCYRAERRTNGSD